MFKPRQGHTCVSVRLNWIQQLGLKANDHRQPQKTPTADQALIQSHFDGTDSHPSPTNSVKGASQGSNSIQP